MTTSLNIYLSNGNHKRIIKDMSALRVISDSGSVCSMLITIFLYLVAGKQPGQTFAKTGTRQTKMLPGKKRTTNRTRKKRMRRHSSGTI